MSKQTRDAWTEAVKKLQAPQKRRSKYGAVKATVVKAVKEVTAKPTDCKKFFASVGMTLTVPCE